MRRFILTSLSLLLLAGAVTAQVSVNTVLQSNLRNTLPGKSVNISTITTCTQFESFKAEDYGPRLIFSDDPEYLKAPGICARETVNKETVRLYLYNVNDSPSNEFKFAIILKNQTRNIGLAAITHRGAKKPSNDYMYLGKSALLEFYQNKTNQPVKIIPFGTALLDSYWNTVPAKNQELAHGFYEFYCAQSTEIILCGLPFNADPLKTYSTLSVLPSSGKNAGRGLYNSSDRKITFNQPMDTKDGVKRFRMADGVIDTWVTGTDNTLNKSVKLIGNYGVFYHIEIPIKSSDDKDFAIVVMSEPSGKDGCAYAGIIGTHPELNLSEPGFYVTPSDKWALADAYTAAMVGIYRPDKETKTVTLEFSPPGSSCLPADFFLIPIERNK